MSAVQPAPTRLYGRERERRQLSAALHEARSGRGGLVLISGDAGIGKTSLVLDTSVQAQDLGMRVASGRAYDLLTTPPYGPWTEIFRGIGTTGEPSPFNMASDLEAPTIASQQGLFQHVRELLSRMAEPDGLLIVFDDAHWADQASLDLLRFLCRSLQHARIVVVASYRTDELSRRHPLYGLIPRLVREASSTRLELKPLDEPTIREWLADVYKLTGPDEDRLVTYLMANAEGNPFFASEILRTLEEDRVLAAGGDGWKLDRLPQTTVPVLLQQVIDMRVSRLPTDGRELLTTAAVIGHDVPLDLWGRVTEAREDALVELLEDAEAIWFISTAPEGSEFSFSHPLFREVLYQSISPARRRIVHRRLAELLEDDPSADPDVVAHHFQQADDERAIDWLVRAAERAWRAWAWIEAADRYQRAIDILATRPERAIERAWLLLRLAESRRYNLPRRALDHVHQAERIAGEARDPVLATAVRWVRARILVATDENGLPDMQAAVAAMEEFDEDGRDRFLSYTDFRVEWAQPIFAVWLAILGRYTESLAASDRYLTSVSDEYRAPLIDAEAYLSRGIAHGALGHPDDSARAFQAALDIYIRQQDNLSVGHTAFLFMIETILPYMAGDLSRREHLAEIGDTAWQEATEINITQAPIVSPPLLLLEGMWDELRAITGRTVGLRNYVRIWTAPYGIAAARNRGDIDLANAFVQAGLPPDAGFNEGTVWISCTLQILRLAAELAMDAGDLTSAGERISSYEKLIGASQRVTGRAEGALLRARFALIGDRPPAALEHASRALELASEPRQPLALLQAHRMLGEIKLALGDLEPAKRHLAAAREISRACSAVYEDALTAYLEGRFALATGDPSQAVKLFDEAAGIASTLGAQPLLDQIEYQRERSESLDEYPDDLTKREVEVLRLVCEGYTDTQIADSLSISPRTVMTHVSNILGKTGAASRAAAAAYAVRRGLA